MKASFVKHILEFNQPGGTSRGTLYTKPSWFIRIDDKDRSGIGECSIIPKLSIDDRSDLEEKIEEVCNNIDAYQENFHEKLVDFPALRFALETAFQGLHSEDPYRLFPSEFTEGKDAIVINGLIWMGKADEMLKRIEDKLSKGFSCLKLKVGAINFEDEKQLLRLIRQRFSSDQLELRVDANGAFTKDEALMKLEELAQFNIHSIEQPIKAGQINEMAQLCKITPLPIALDEELIGVHALNEKCELINAIQPQFIILKPSLLGGWKASDEWIQIAEQNNVAWWATSALESNIGLNAIAQWVYLKKSELRQGLGTGQVFSNNIDSPLYLQGEQLCYNPDFQWQNPLELSGHA